MASGCVQCGAQIDEGQKFCRYCGSPAPVASTPGHCPNCGAQAGPGQAFCTECGVSLTDPRSPAGSAPSWQPSEFQREVQRAKTGDARSGDGMGRGVVLFIVLLVLAGGGYLLVTSSPDGSVAKLAANVPGLSSLMPRATSQPAKSSGAAPTAAAPAKGTQEPTAAVPAKGTQAPTVAPAKGAQATVAPAGTTLSQNDLKGNWTGSMILTGINVEALSAQQKKELEADFARMVGKPQPLTLIFEPKANDGGSVVMDSAGDKSPALPYKYQGGRLTVEWDQQGIKTAFEGAATRKASGFSLDGTVTAVGKESGATMKIQGIWTVAKP